MSSEEQSTTSPQEDFVVPPSSENLLPSEPAPSTPASTATSAPEKTAKTSAEQTSSPNADEFKEVVPAFTKKLSTKWLPDRVNCLLILLVIVYIPVLVAIIVRLNELLTGSEFLASYSNKCVIPRGLPKYFWKEELKFLKQPLERTYIPCTVTMDLNELIQFDPIGVNSYEYYMRLTTNGTKILNIATLCTTSFLHPPKPDGVVSLETLNSIREHAKQELTPQQVREKVVEEFAGITLDEPFLCYIGAKFGGYVIQNNDPTYNVSAPGYSFLAFHRDVKAVLEYSFPNLTETDALNVVSSPAMAFVEPEVEEFYHVFIKKHPYIQFFEVFYTLLIPAVVVIVTGIVLLGISCRRKIKEKYFADKEATYDVDDEEEVSRIEERKRKHEIIDRPDVRLISEADIQDTKPVRRELFILAVSNIYFNLLFRSTGTAVFVGCFVMMRAIMFNYTLNFNIFERFSWFYTMQYYENSILLFYAISFIILVMKRFLKYEMPIWYWVFMGLAFVCLIILETIVIVVQNVIRSYGTVAQQQGLASTLSGIIFGYAGVFFVLVGGAGPFLVLSKYTCLCSPHKNKQVILMALRICALVIVPCVLAVLVLAVILVVLLPIYVSAFTLDGQETYQSIMQVVISLGCTVVIPPVIQLSLGFLPKLKAKDPMNNVIDQSGAFYIKGMAYIINSLINRMFIIYSINVITQVTSLTINSLIEVTRFIVDLSFLVSLDFLKYASVGGKAQWARETFARYAATLNPSKPLPKTGSQQQSMVHISVPNTLENSVSSVGVNIATTTKVGTFESLAIERHQESIVGGVGSFAFIGKNVTNFMQEDELETARDRAINDMLINFMIINLVDLTSIFVAPMITYFINMRVPSAMDIGLIVQVVILQAGYKILTNLVCITFLYYKMRRLMFTAWEKYIKSHFSFFVLAHFVMSMFIVYFFMDTIIYRMNSFIAVMNDWGLQGIFGAYSGTVLPLFKYRKPIFSFD